MFASAHPGPRECAKRLFATLQENEGCSTFKLFHGDGSGNHLFGYADYSGDIIPDLQQA
jgi:hypothetical protein